MRIARVLLVTLAFGLAAADAGAQPYALGPHGTTGGGTPSMSGGPYTIAGAAGQADASGPVTGGPYTVAGGFWTASLPGDDGTDLSITIADVEDPVGSLQPVVYQIDATNAGANTASTVSIVVTLAAGVTLESASAAGWSCDGEAGIVTCTRASLEPATTAPLTLLARAPAGPATLQTVATIDSATPDTAPGNNSGVVVTSVMDAPGDAPSIVITAPAVTAAALATSPLPVVSGEATAGTGDIAQVSWTNSRGGSGVATGGAMWTLPGLVLQPGVNIVTVTVRNTNGQTASDVIALSLTAYYVAEGSTGTFFDTDIAIVNPNAAPVPGTITFLTPEGKAVEQTFSAPPRSRQTIAVDTIAGVESTPFSTVVTSHTGAPLIVERTLAWDASGYGGHGDAATAPAPQWYFAEGAQGFFSTYLLLFNPHGETNRAAVHYLREGAASVTRTYDLAPMARLTIDAGADPELVDRSFGMRVTFDRPALAERAMYFGGAPLWRAGHGAAGLTQPSPTWFFAEGATGPYFETFILLSNPNSTAANVTLTFLPDTGVPVTVDRTIPAMERITVNIEQDAPALANAAVATQVTATQPIVAERAQYWPFTPDRWVEAHVSAGVRLAGRDWALAEGRVGGEQAYQTYILLANPGAADAHVEITFVRESGDPVIKSFTVPPTSRFNVAVGPGTLVPELTDERFGAVIHSTQPIMVERSMYWNANGEIWSAGTNVTATRLQP